MTHAAKRIHFKTEDPLVKKAVPILEKKLSAGTVLFPFGVNGFDRGKRVKPGAHQKKDSSSTSWIPKLKLREPSLELTHREDELLPILRASAQAYFLHKDHQNLELGDDPRPGEVLFKIQEAMEKFSKEKGFRHSIVENSNNNGYKIILIEQLDQCDNNLTIELKYLPILEKRRPKSFHVVASLIHLIMKDAGIPDWTEMVHFSKETVDFHDSDPEELEARPELEADLTYYQKEEPARWIKKLRRYKGLNLKALASFKTNDKLLTEIVRCGVNVLQHPLNFHDYNSFLSNDEGIYPYQYVNFGWDFDRELEMDYGKYLDDSYGSVGIVPPRRIIAIEKKSDWNNYAMGDAFFLNFSGFLKSLSKLFKRYARN